MTDQELHERVAAVLLEAVNEGMKAALITGIWQYDSADRLLADTALLDDICEYRARQLNAERRGGTTWKSSADVPAGQRFRSVEFPNSVTWRRDVGGALAETPHGDGRIYPTSVVDRDWGDNGFEATPHQLGIADIERITAMPGFVLAQTHREAAASVALDHGDVGTYSVGMPVPEEKR